MRGSSLWGNDIARLTQDGLLRAEPCYETDTRQQKWPPGPAAMDTLASTEGSGARCLRDADGLPSQDTVQDAVRVPLPSDDAFRAVHQEGGVAPDAVRDDLPEACQRLRVQDTHDHPLPVRLARLPDPVREAQVLRLHVLRVLVDFLVVDFLADPRSLQERFAVGSVVEPGQNRRHHFNNHRPHVTFPLRRQAPLTLSLSRHPLHWEEQRVPGRGYQRMCPSPSMPGKRGPFLPPLPRWERAPRGYPVRVSGGIRE